MLASGWTVTAAMGPDGKINGEGTAVHKDGRRFAGVFDDGYPARGRIDQPGIGVFEGEFSDGWCHGQCKGNYEDGAVYVGQWAQRCWHGAGKLVDAAGTTFEGPFVLGYLKQGKAVYADGTLYEGTFGGSSRRRQGQGKLVRPSGVTLEGVWCYDKLEGDGKCLYPDGAIYEGHFSASLPDGAGERRYPDGRKICGPFRRDKVNGFATFTSATLLYSGQWRDDVPDGDGRAIFLDNQDTVIGKWTGGVLRNTDLRPYLVPAAATAASASTVAPADAQVSAAAPAAASSASIPAAATS